MKNVAAIVMAGGRGVRMRMPTTKMLAPILGRPLICFPTKLALDTIDGPVVVVSGEYLSDVKEAVLSVLPPERLHFARQEQPLGTADAVKAGVAGLPDDNAEFVLVLNGDVPGTSTALMQQMVAQCETRGADICVLAFRPDDPFGYGRILTDDSGTVLAIREEKELAEEERAVDVVNAGLYIVRLSHLKSFLATVKPSPNQREYLLTDVVEWIVAQGGLADVLVAEDPAEVAGVNDQAQLSDVAARIRRQCNHKLMMAGVAMPFPDSVEVELGVTVGPGTTLEANAQLRGRTSVGEGCVVATGSVLVDTNLADNVRVQPYCVLESTVVASSCNLGPFAHTRPGTVLEEGAKVGNFVETKKTTIGKGAKASHLSYIGDATVGAKANIGAGTITCNYDGYRKFPTHIGEGAFIGSDTQLVAPVNVGDHAVVAAGTTVTKDVPAGALAVSRVEQANRPGYSEAKRRRMERDKK
jgi:bifunctional UDP-N-acetylglucosamine pyrophosphorylase / glucosamine-1-phosphate N-acetyltransferase